MHRESSGTKLGTFRDEKRSRGKKEKARQREVQFGFDASLVCDKL